MTLKEERMMKIMVNAAKIIKLFFQILSIQTNFVSDVICKAATIGLNCSIAAAVLVEILSEKSSAENVPTQSKAENP